eukprot:CAMPEP_0182578866 /NCGR_PEP_ID=MMETSP1324-20130603/42457_1 /TAXON_ID=236786 /ORGANISM="Florenciella sp., Strain RCC1587" /LENGTH=68 /DNA_ID=CAMNT_0024794877 /DNA_START=185 /DNA_END=388 /DNA_ORIENTATION=+
MSVASCHEDNLAFQVTAASAIRSTSAIWRLDRKKSLSSSWASEEAVSTSSCAENEASLSSMSACTESS